MGSASSRDALLARERARSAATSSTSGPVPSDGPVLAAPATARPTLGARPQEIALIAAAENAASAAASANGPAGIVGTTAPNSTLPETTAAASSASAAPGPDSSAADPDAALASAAAAAAAAAAAVAATDSPANLGGDGPHRVIWSRPAAPPAMHRHDTIKNDVNLHKNSLKLTRDEENPDLYLIEFSFDAAVAGDVTVYFCARETTHLPRERRLRFEGRYDKKPIKTPFKEGFGQLYRQKRARALDVSQFTQEELVYQDKSDVYPIVIRLEAADAASPGDDNAETPDDAAEDASKSRIRSQCTFATLRQAGLPNSPYYVEILSQKILVGDTTYKLQEIYGIQNAGRSGADAGQDDTNPSPWDNPANEAVNLADGSECVICLSENRDTVVLPCRHLCLCSECAMRLRTRSNKCPVCRSRVESLLQIKDIWRPEPEPVAPKGVARSNSTADPSASSTISTGPTATEELSKEGGSVATSV